MVFVAEVTTPSKARETPQKSVGRFPTLFPGLSRSQAHARISWFSFWPQEAVFVKLLNNYRIQGHSEPVQMMQWVHELQVFELQSEKIAP